MASLRLPADDGSLFEYTLSGAPVADQQGGEFTSRIAYAAAHVVADPLRDNTPGQPAQLDWDATMRFRHHLWSHGLGVADAMDTAQRGMGLDWPTTRELIKRSGKEAESVGGKLVCGAGTDQLPDGAVSLDQLVAAYAEQTEVIEGAGATVVLMASRQMAASAQSAQDYADVYRRVLANVSRKVVLHWLGPMFDPALEGYWGSADLDTATVAFLDLIHENSDKIEGLKMSLLDADREVALRKQLPSGVRCYTGDDFNYPDLILGDDDGYSDALLGIFDAIAPAAAAAIRALDDSDEATYRKLIDPTVPLSRHIFETPTFHYKTGVVFLAWLSGHQDHFVMVGGLQSARSVPHLAKLLVLADEASLIPDPDLAARRMRQFLDVAGVAA